MPMRVLRILSTLFAAMITTFGVTAPLSATADYQLFESGQVRPLAISPSGHYLFALNTPDNRLEVYRIEKHRLRHVTSVMVGLEPVAVAARSDHEVWVV